MYDCLLTEEEKALKYEVRKFVKDEVPVQLLRDMDADKVRYPRSFVEALGKRNLLGLRFPKEWGGRGLKWTGEVAAIEEAGILGSALGCAFVMPSIVGEALNLFGTPKQKEKYLKPLLAGKIVSAEALTEPRGGSDFFGATTKAIRDGNHYVLNGAKRFVVGAEGADLFLVYAKTSPDAPAHSSISLFAVEREMGVEVKSLYGLMGTRGGGTGRIIFRDVRVPVENLVGDQDMGGLIFNCMMVPERLTSAAGALGFARAALEVATRYTTKRVAFGRVIRKFQGVSFRIADSATLLDAARSLTYLAARSIDAGLDNRGRRLVSEAKKFATEAGWQIVNNAMQVMGGIGYTNVYPIERLLRDGRLGMIWTGSSEVMSMLIQHEYYNELAEREAPARDVEQDVPEELADEKCFTDEDMWRML